MLSSVVNFHPELRRDRSYPRRPSLRPAPAPIEDPDPVGTRSGCLCVKLSGSLPSYLSQFTVIHPFSIQPLTKCSSRNSLVLNSIHFDGGGVPPLYEEIMNSYASNSSSTIDIPAVTTRKPSTSRQASTGGRCHHRFPNGKRCRKYGTTSHFGLCRTHYDASAALGASLHQDQSDFTDLSAELLPELSEFAAGADIRQFLARLLVLVTKGRISPRRASVLGYITNQLLHSHRAIALEAAPPGDEQTRIVIDMPRPDRD